MGEDVDILVCGYENLCIFFIYDSWPFFLFQIKIEIINCDFESLLLVLSIFTLVRLHLFLNFVLLFLYTSMTFLNKWTIIFHPALILLLISYKVLLLLFSLDPRSSLLCDNFCTYSFLLFSSSYLLLSYILPINR